ncbi:DUF2837 family protein [Vibrio cholerae]
MLYLSIALFISFAIIIETIGVWFRYIGAQYGEAASGYSTHVRIATLGRFFILLAAPLLGYSIDNGVNHYHLAFIGFLTFFIVFLILLLAVLTDVGPLFSRIYSYVNRTELGLTCICKIRQQKINKSMFFPSCLSFLFTASGLVFVNYLAAKMPDNRAMIVQMSAVITMLGTLLHVFLVDPKLARLCDTDIDEALNSIANFLFGRLVSSILLCLIFLLLSV